MIDKLEFFIALAKHGHFGKAAESCGITQPSLSSSIRQLEEQLGVILVLRGSRYKGLTPEGQRVLEWARRIVGDTRTMREEMKATQKGLSGHVRIATIPTASVMVCKLTEPFIKRHPDVSLSVAACTSLEVLSRLENFDIDIGLTYLDNEPLGRVTSVALYKEKYQLIVKKGGPMSDRGSVSWAELSDIPLCLLTPNMQNRRIINKHLKEAGIDVTPTIESDSMIVLFSHIMTGNWASIMPVNLAEILGFGSNIKAIPIHSPDAEHSVGLVAAKREPNTPIVSAFLHEAKLFASRHT